MARRVARRPGAGDADARAAPAVAAHLDRRTGLTTAYLYGSLTALAPEVEEAVADQIGALR